MHRPKPDFNSAAFSAFVVDFPFCIRPAVGLAYNTDKIYYVQACSILAYCVFIDRIVATRCAYGRPTLNAFIDHKML